jgi:Concanavalin A-like lectin/glucanases superfamily
VSYESAVLADSPTFLWLLNETSGGTAADATGNGNVGNYPGSGYAPSTLVAPLFQSASANMSGGQIIANESITAFSAVSAECWFSTTTALGGGITQYGNTNFVIYMHNDGTLTFGIWTGSAVETAGPTGTAYNDGKWHYMVATFDGGSTNMVFYIDGAQVATGNASTYAAGNHIWYVAAGGNISTNWPGTQTNDNLTGYLAAAATYPAVLSQARVTAHYAASGYGPKTGTKYLTSSAVPALISSVM